MSPRRLPILIAPVFAASLHADIAQWNAAIPSSKYVIDPVLRTITITEGDFGVFKFEAFDPGTNAPSDIDAIAIDTNGAGVVNLMVDGDPSAGRSRGARDVKRINLSNSDGRIVAIDITGTLGSLGSVVANSIGTVGGLPSFIQVDGNLVNGIFVSSSTSNVFINGNCAGGVSLGGMTGNVTVGGTLTGSIIGSSLGNVTVNGTGPHTAGVGVTNGAGTYSGIVFINGPTTGNVSFLGNLGGSVTINGDYSGLFTVTKDLTANGHILVNGTLSNGASGAGRLHIREHMLAGSSVTCQNMDLRDTTTDARWFVVGNQFGLDYGPNENQFGTVTVTTALTGRIKINGRSGLVINIGTLNAPGTSPGTGDDGIEAERGFLPQSSITVGAFVDGRLGLSDATKPADQPFEGAINITGAMQSGARISTLNPNTAGGERSIDVTAQIAIGGNMSGNIQGTGDLAGPIAVGGAMSGTIEGPADVTGLVTIAGNMSGTITGIRDLTGRVTVGGDMSGRIEASRNLTGRVHMVSYFQPSGRVIFLGSMQSGAAVVVDYDGGPNGVNDPDWKSGAQVQIGGNTYTHGKHPPIFVWDTSECKADLNGDATVNTFDINGFLDALGNPTAYEATYPGLEGSRVFHGDCNCDGSLNAFDINGFIQRLTEHCCSSACGSCGGFLMAGGAQGYTPGYVAKLFEENATPTHISILEHQLVNLIGRLAPGDEADYWKDVLSEIGE